MDLNAFLDQVVADLQTIVGPAVPVLRHPGRFDLNELERFAMQAPCVRLAWISGTDIDVQTQFDDRIDLVAYLLTRTGKSGEAAVQMVALAQAVRIGLRTAAFGGADAAAPSGVVYQNLYSSLLGEAGVTLGAVSWKQIVTLPNAVDTAALADFLTFDATYQIDGETVATDDQTLPQD